MTYSIRTVQHSAGFKALRAEWERLCSDAADANTFMTHAWLESWWLAYQPAAELRIVLAERDRRIWGIAPMMLTREGGLQSVFRRLRFIGDGTSETDHMNFVVHVSDRAAILGALFKGIDALPWDVAHFTHLPSSSQNALELEAFARSHGWLTTRAEIACPRRTLPDSFEALLQSLPSRMRTAIRSGRRDLEKHYRLAFGMYEDGKDLEGALEALYRNHASRWRAKGEDGVFVSARKRAFYLDLSRRLLDKGELRFFFLKLDGRVVAQQFCFEYGGTVYLLQEGFDYDYAKLNVGNVLRAMVFERLISRGVRCYDFLAGTSRHKEAWSDSVPADLSLRVCRASVMGRIAHYAPAWIESAKRAIRPGQREPSLS